MKNIITAIAVVILLNSKISNSQTANITWGKTQENASQWGGLLAPPTSQMRYNIVSANDKTILVDVDKVTSTSTGKYMEEYSLEALDKISSVEINKALPNHPKASREYFVYSDGGFDGFYSEKNKAAKVYDIYYQRVSKEGKPVGIEKKITCVPKDKVTEYSIHFIPFRFPKSKDGSKRLCMNFCIEKKTAIIWFEMFDKDFKKIDAGEYSVQLTYDDLSTNNVYLSNNGDINILLTNQMNDIVKDAKVITYTASSKQFSETDLKAEKDVYRFNGSLNQKGEFVFAGLYTDRRSARDQSLSGMALTNGNPGKIKLFAFPMNLPEKIASKYVNGPEMYDFVKSFTSSDGSQYFVLEQQLSTNAPGMSSYLYECLNILVVKADNTGPVWEKVILKEQSYNVGYGIGFMYQSLAGFMANDKLVLFYADNPSNINATNYKDLKRAVNMDKAALYMSVVDANGNEKKQIVCDMKDVGMNFVAKSMYQLSPTEYIIYAENGSKYKFGKITVSW